MDWGRTIPNANIGLDLELLNRALDISVDVFSNDRTRIITTRSSTLPGIVGQELPYENIGSVLNQGFEASVTHSKQAGQFKYFVQAHVSYANNKITYTDEVQNLEPWLSMIGRSVTQQWGLQTDGFFANQDDVDAWPVSTYGLVKPGDLKYIDQNKDNFINDDDRVPLENLSFRNGTMVCC